MHIMMNERRELDDDHCLNELGNMTKHGKQNDQSTLTRFLRNRLELPNTNMYIHLCGQSTVNLYAELVVYQMRNHVRILISASMRSARVTHVFS